MKQHWNNFRLPQKLWEAKTKTKEYIATNGKDSNEPLRTMFNSKLACLCCAPAWDRTRTVRVLQVGPKIVVPKISANQNDDVVGGFRLVFGRASLTTRLHRFCARPGGLFLQL